jgi:hypothetical protein
MEWAALFRLKKRWRVSVAAMVRRAYDLRLIDAASYKRAYKSIASKGWLKGEPEEFEPEAPELLDISLATLKERFGASTLDVCDRLRWRPYTFEQVTGIPMPCEPTPPRLRVVQLALLRSERVGSGK